MKGSHRYRERDYTFGNLFVTLRTALGLSQAELARLLDGSERAIQTWEGGLNYPKVERLKRFIELCIERHAFTPGNEQDEARALWKLAQPKVLFDEQWLNTLLSRPSSTAALTLIAAPISTTSTHVDWGEAFDVSHFYGRVSELAELARWVVEDRCRVVAVLGMGGIGKSTLTVTVMRQVALHFQSVVWRSLRNVPTCDELLTDLVQTLSTEPLRELPETLEQRLQLVLELLRARRCLLVLDNLETLLLEGDEEGRYREGYEWYGQLVQRIGEINHQSCLILTSREKPAALGVLEGPGSPVRSMRLAGLDGAAGEQLLQEKGLTGDAEAKTRLIEAYSGNPLALKIVAESVRSLFAGDIGLFLAEGELLFRSVRTLLAQQFARLTPFEQHMLCWLAVMREPGSIADLLAAQVAPVSRTRLLETLEALRRRSLVESGLGQASFTLQSMVLEYVTDLLVERASQEVQRGAMQQLCTHALEQGWAKDYVRRTQQRLLVAPTLARLRVELAAQKEIEASLLSLLEALRRWPENEQGYGPANLMALLRELRGNLRGVDLSHLTIREAYLQGVEMQDASLQGAQLREVVFTDAFRIVTKLAVHAKSGAWAAGTDNGDVRIWHGQERVPHLILRAHTSISDLDIAPDGRMLASGGRDRLVKVWDMESGALIWTLEGHRDIIQHLSYAPDGRILASSSTDGTIRLWNLTNGECSQILDAQAGMLFGVAWHPTRPLLAGGYSDGLIRLWDVERGTCVQTFAGHTHWVIELAFSPDGTSLASVSWDMLVKLWDVERGFCIQTFAGHSAAVNAVAFSPDGRTIASGSTDTVIHLWDVARGVAAMSFFGHRDTVYSVAFVKGGVALLSGGQDRTIREWEVATGRCVRIIEGYMQALYDVAYSPDGTKLACGNLDASITLWDGTTGTPLRSLQGHTQITRSVSWSPDGRQLASGSFDQTVRIWDINTGVCTHLFRRHNGIVICVAWQPGDQAVASIDNQDMLCLWDVARGTLRWTGHADTEPGSGIAWSPDGQQLACIGADRVIRLLGVEDGNVLRTLHGQQAPAEVVAWSPDGMQLLSGGGNGELVELLLWDVRSGQLLQSFSGHKSRITSLAWHPSGTLFVSVGLDRTIRLWDVKRGMRLKSDLNAGRSYISISPDGDTLATSSGGMIILWNLHRLEPLRTLRLDRPYERLNISGARGLAATQKDTLRMLGAVDLENLVIPPPA